MKKSALIFATTAALAFTGIASTRPAEARHGGFGPGIAGGVIAGAVIAGAASSAYAWGPGSAYDGYSPYYAPGPYGHSYYEGSVDESKHGGQPYYGRPF